MFETGWLQIDWLDKAAAVVAVHRNTVTLTPIGEAARDEALRAMRHKLAERFVTPANPYATVNATLLSVPPPPSIAQEWPVNDGALNRSCAWRRLTLPVMEGQDLAGRQRTASGQQVSSLRGIYTSAMDTSGLLVWSREMPPADCIFEHRDAGPTPVWTRDFVTTARRRGAARPVADFPPNWLHVAGAALERTFWNGANVWVATGLPSFPDVHQAWMHYLLRPCWWRDFETVPTVAALFLIALTELRRETVAEIQSDREFMRAAIDKCVRAGLTLPVVVWHAYSPTLSVKNPHLQVLSRSGVRQIVDRAEIRRLVPTAPDDWHIVEEPSEARRRRLRFLKRTRSKAR